MQGFWLLFSNHLHCTVPSLGLVRSVEGGLRRFSTSPVLSGGSWGDWNGNGCKARDVGTWHLPLTYFPPADQRAALPRTWSGLCAVLVRFVPRGGGWIFAGVFLQIPLSTRSPCSVVSLILHIPVWPLSPPEIAVEGSGLFVVFAECFTSAVMFAGTVGSADFSLQPPNCLRSKFPWTLPCFWYLIFARISWLCIRKNNLWGKSWL